MAAPASPPSAARRFTGSDALFAAGCAALLIAMAFPETWSGGLGPYLFLAAGLIMFGLLVALLGSFVVMLPFAAAAALRPARPARLPDTLDWSRVPEGFTPLPEPPPPKPWPRVKLALAAATMALLALGVPHRLAFAVSRPAFDRLRDDLLAGRIDNAAGWHGGRCLAKAYVEKDGGVYLELAGGSSSGGRQTEGYCWYPGPIPESRLQRQPSYDWRFTPLSGGWHSYSCSWRW